MWLCASVSARFSDSLVLLDEENRHNHARELLRCHAASKLRSHDLTFVPQSYISVVDSRPVPFLLLE
jgi:hypothetical protein